MTGTTAEQHRFIFDGTRAVRTDQIQSVEPHESGRVIRTVDGREYLSDGDALDLVDLLM